MDSIYFQSNLPPLTSDNFDFTAEYPKDREVDIAEDCPYLIHHEGHSLIPKHFERYIRIHHLYKHGIRRSSGSTLGDKLTKRKKREKREYDPTVPHRGRPPKEKPRIYTQTQVGDLLDVSSHTIGHWRTIGYIPKEAVYTKHTFLADTIDMMIDEGELPPDIYPEDDEPDAVNSVEAEEPSPAITPSAEEVPPAEIPSTAEEVSPAEIPTPQPECIMTEYYTGQQVRDKAQP